MSAGFSTGQHIGDYEIISILGAGGSAKVYKVRNVISLRRVEAMKKSSSPTSPPTNRSPTASSAKFACSPRCIIPTSQPCAPRSPTKISWS